MLIFTNKALSWTGYEKDSTNMIEISQGNLVREGLVIDFFDANNSQTHQAEVLLLEYDGSFTKLILFDIDLQKEREFLMD